MKKFISSVFAFLFAAASFASGDTPAEWYTPDGYSKFEKSGKVKFGIKDTEYDAILDDDGKVYLDTPQSVDLTKAEEDAMIALGHAWKAQAQVETLADTLYKSAIVDIKAETSDGKTTLKWYTKQGQNSGAGGGTASGSASLNSYKVLVDENGTFALYENGTKLTGSGEWLSAEGDRKSIGKTDEGVNSKICLHSWRDEPGKDIKLADQMTSDTDDTTTRVLVKVGGVNGYLGYWSLGKLGAIRGGKVDGASIVTNETGDGSASIKGFHKDASNGSVPFANGSTINWTDSPAKGSLLGADKDTTPRWTYTQSGNYYYGTTKTGGDLGWHEMPNVTTNAVEADDATIKSTIENQSVKKLSLYSAPGSDGRLYGAFMSNGKLGWAAVAEPPTNTQYGVDAVSIDTNGLEGVLQIARFKDMNGGYLVKSDGKVKSQFFIATNGIERSETTGELNLKSTIGLEKWDEPHGTCAENLGGILTGQIQEKDGDHYVLTRYKDGDLHYTKIGRVPSAEADGVTITTNNTGSADNKLAIAGAYDPNNADKVLASTGSGTKWITAGGGSALAFYGWDGTSATGPIVVGSGSVTNAVRFASAEDSNVKVTCESDNDGGVTVTIGVYYK